MKAAASETVDEAKGFAARGAALLGVRQVLVGLFTVAGIVALPRLLTPAEFSLYGYVNTVVLVGAALGDLGLGAYLIKNRISDRDLSGSIALQLAFWIPASLLALAVGLVFSPFGFEPLTVSLLVFGLLLFSLQALPTALLEKNLAFKQISAIEVTQRVMLVGVAIVLAVLSPGQWVIPAGAAVAALFGYPAAMVVARWRWRPRFKQGEPLFRGFSSEWWQVRAASQAAYATYPLLGGILFTAHDVGLIVWALAVTTIPAYLAPMVARATYPAMTRANPEHRTEIFSSLLRVLLLIGGPMITFILIAADPLTSLVFGNEWLEGIPLLRLESITSLIGIGLSLVIPLLFLESDPKRIKWMSVIYLAGIIVLSIALAPIVSLKAISIATIFCSSCLLVGYSLMVRSATGHNPLRDMFPAVAGIVAGCAVGLPVALGSGSDLPVLLAGLVAALVQIGVTYALKGGISPGSVLRLLRPEPAAD
ncbi:MAG TPA: oligosaccharide flippase family protein [Solirubrobacterales bacterium]|nr:oligosaccharide flippase family protein [Solirubrobacterales bacterium]